jgi:hypothetical protein
MSEEVLRPILPLEPLAPTEVVKADDRGVIPPLTVNAGNLRVVFFVNPDFGNDVVFDHKSTQQAVNDWLDGKKPMGLIGIDRIEIYELPEQRRSS